MKTLFQLYCLIRSVPWYASEVMWNVYHDRTKAEWFRVFYGRSLFTADVHFMRCSSVFMDFLNDEGVNWTLVAFQASYTEKEYRAGIWKFCMYFVKEIVTPFVVDTEKVPVKEVSREDFVVMKGLFVRSLSRWLAERNKMDDEHYVPYLNKFLIA